MAVNGFVLVDEFEHEWCGGSVGDFEVLEWTLGDCASEFIREVFDAYLR